MRLVRLASIVPLFMPLLALGGCWDFAALNATNSRVDGGGEDMYFCDKSPLSVAEDCTDGIDNNDDCRTDCEDPQCATTHLKCVDPMNQIIGYGSKIQMAAMCPGAQSTTAINQNLSLNGNCSTGCACQANSNWRCSSTLHVSNTQADCMNNIERGNAALLSGAGGTPLNDCDAIPGTAAVTDYFKIDNIVSQCPVDTASRGTLAASWGSQQKFCSTAPSETTCQTISCMAMNAQCIAFNGTSATCPSPFAFKEIWYRGYTDNRTCTCACGAGANSCSIAMTQAQFMESATCMTGGMLKTSAATMTAMCIQANLAMMTPAAGFSFQARPVCTPSGTAPTDLATETTAGRVTLNNPITLCCQQ